MFGQQQQQQQQQGASTAEADAEAQKRAEAQDRRVRLKEYTVMQRFAEPDKATGLNGKRVEAYIRKVKMHVRHGLCV
jgi:hypothetical protein